MPAAVLPFSQGDAVYVWSSSQNRWCTDGIITGVDDECVQVLYDSKRSSKWLSAEQARNTLQKAGPRLPETPPTAAIQPNVFEWPMLASPQGFVAGESVSVWSNSCGRWLHDGVVEEVVNTSQVIDGCELEAGSVKVVFDEARSCKWLSPVQAVAVLRKKSQRQGTPPPMMPPMLKMPPRTTNASGLLNPPGSGLLNPPSGYNAAASAGVAANGRGVSPIPAVTQPYVRQLPKPVFTPPESSGTLVGMRMPMAAPIVAAASSRSPARRLRFESRPDSPSGNGTPRIAAPTAGLFLARSESDRSIPSLPLPRGVAVSPARSPRSSTPRQSPRPQEKLPPTPPGMKLSNAVRSEPVETQCGAGYSSPSRSKAGSETLQLSSLGMQTALQLKAAERPVTGFSRGLGMAPAWRIQIQQDVVLNRKVLDLERRSSSNSCWAGCICLPNHRSAGPKSPKSKPTSAGSTSAKKQASEGSQVSASAELAEQRKSTGRKPANPSRVLKLMSEVSHQASITPCRTAADEEVNMTKRRLAREPARHRYRDWSSIRAALDGDRVVLLRGDWLMQQRTRLPRRQDLPAEAVWDPDSLLRGIGYGVAVVTVSYNASIKDSEPSADQIATLAALLSNFASCGSTPLASNGTMSEVHGAESIAVFLERCSLHQKPRTVPEERIFKEAMADISLWYAHELIHVWMLHGSKSQSRSCWHFFEESCAALAAPGFALQDVGYGYPAWETLAGEKACLVSRRAPLTPARFASELQDIDATDLEERKFLAQQYARAHIEVLADAEVLDYTGMEWADDDARTLAMLFADCQSLRSLGLSHNAIGDDGAEWLASHLPWLRTLKVLHLRANKIGDIGAKALASALPACLQLVELDISANQVGDIGISALAEAVHACPQLEILVADRNRHSQGTAKTLSDALAWRRYVRTAGIEHDRQGSGYRAA